MSCSKLLSHAIAYSRAFCCFWSPHISRLGFKLPQKLGRSGLLKIAHLKSLSKWIQATPAGLPFGMPGKGVLIEGAMQHAPQFGLQSIKIYTANLHNIDPSKTNAAHTCLDILHGLVDYLRRAFCT